MATNGSQAVFIAIFCEYLREKKKFAKPFLPVHTGAQVESFKPQNWLKSRDTVLSKSQNISLIHVEKLNFKKFCLQEMQLENFLPNFRYFQKKKVTGRKIKGCVKCNFKCFT